VLRGRIAYLICSMVWFMPFAWMALSRLRLEQEKACDEEAMSTFADNSSYAELLVRLGASFRRQSLLALLSAPAAGSWTLEERVRSIIRGPARRARSPRLARSLLAAGILLVLVPLSLIRCAPAPAEPHAAALASLPATASPVLIWPIKGDVGLITNKFGSSTDPFTRKPAFHTGIDLAWAKGNAIVAAHSGTVTEIGFDEVDGNFIRIGGASVIGIFYSHLGSVEVRKGEEVVVGQTIALMGNSGRSTGPHVHFEVTQNGALVDPLLFLPPQESLKLSGRVIRD
jgi:murein DD-endopeptidase MepM/ murein hydrolase activator NlpD